MKKRDLTYLWLLLTICIIVTGFTLITHSGNYKILLINGFIIDGTGEDPISNGFVLIEKGIITNIGYNYDKDQLGGNFGIKVIDLDGKTVIPGIIDSHIHLEYNLLSSPRFLR